MCRVVEMGKGSGADKCPDDEFAPGGGACHAIRPRLFPARTGRITGLVRYVDFGMSERPVQPGKVDSPDVRAALPASHLSPLEAAEHRRAVVLQVLRLCFLVLFGTVALLSILSVTTSSERAEINRAIGWWQTLVVAGVLGALVVLIDIATPRKKVGTLFAVFTGLMAAMLATVAVGFIIDLLAKTYDFESNKGLIATTKVLTGIGLAYLCITTIIQTQDDFRLVIPYVEFAKQIRGPRPLVLDTSALIDGRIADLAATGIIQYPVVIPTFVLAELQTLADSGDKMKRARGRRGLELVSRLQRSPAIDVSIDTTEVAGAGVDAKLVELAQQMQATIVTTDVALNRMAGIHHVRILNLNDVASALKPALIPGQTFGVRLIKAGEQATQGVGYLEDGTMVVAEDGAGQIGEQVQLVVTSTLQTSAGRMIFGRLASGAPGSEQPEATGVEAVSEGEEPRTLTVEEPASIAPPLTVPPPMEVEKRGPFGPRGPARRANPARNPRR
jgi:uncharacterized protein YacL